MRIKIKNSKIIRKQLENQLKEKFVDELRDTVSED